MPHALHAMSDALSVGSTALVSTGQLRKVALAGTGGIPWFRFVLRVCTVCVGAASRLVLAVGAWA